MVCAVLVCVVTSVCDCHPLSFGVPALGRAPGALQLPRRKSSSLGGDV